MKKTILICLLLIFSFPIFAQQKTIVSDAKAKQRLLGRHRLSLQWISWDYFGAAAVTQKNGVMYLKGNQKGRGNADFLTVDGIITSIGAKEFLFDGKIVTQIGGVK